MKEAIKNIICMVVAIIIFGSIGTIFGSGISHLLFCDDSEPRTQHMCQCELCKTRRQLESCEVIDSIIKDRIVIVQHVDK